MLVAMIVGLAVVTAESVGPLSDKARQYADWFIGGGYQYIEKDLTPEMKAAMPPERLRAIAKSLDAKYGLIKNIGDPWVEDHVGTYVRYRVPLYFANETIDMRIVFDSKGLVAGTFFVAHVPRPITGQAMVREDRVSVGTDSTSLPGLLALPDGQGPFPAVILVQGSGPVDRDGTIGPNKPLRDIAWGLAKRGIASLRYDKRSFARPADLVAIGEAVTVDEEVINDVRSGLALLRKSPSVDPNAIFVLGHSLGGTLAPRIAQPEPQPAGVIILAGATLPLPEKMLQQARYIASVDGRLSREERAEIEDIQKNVEIIRSALDGEPVEPGFYLGAPIGYYRDLEEYDAPGVMASLDLPCLILQGSIDYQVTLDDFALWQEALADRSTACLRVFDGLDHLFRKGKTVSVPADYDTAGVVAPAVIDCIAQWIKALQCCNAP
jgi:dienelactone hydrolase